MRITQRELTALLRLFGNGSLKTKLAALVVVISAEIGRASCRERVSSPV